MVEVGHCALLRALLSPPCCCIVSVVSVLFQSCRVSQLAASGSSILLSTPLLDSSPCASQPGCYVACVAFVHLNCWFDWSWSSGFCQLVAFSCFSIQSIFLGEFGVYCVLLPLYFQALRTSRLTTASLGSRRIA